MAFDDRDILVMRRLAGVIVPTDADPGADQAPVAEMIEQTALTWPEERQAALLGALDGLDDYAAALFGVGALEATDADFAELVALIASDPAWSAFWDAFRTLVCLDFFALPAGYLPLGLPGPSIDAGGLPV